MCYVWPTEHSFRDSLNQRSAQMRGRALMQLDYQQFLIKVKSLTTVRPIPEQELVEEYIKAYYLTEPALLDWIKTQKRLSTRTDTRISPLHD